MGRLYVAFVLDAFSRRILGWRAASSMRTDLVLDLLEMAIWTRARAGVGYLTGLEAHHDAGSQYTSIRHTERLAEAGARTIGRQRQRRLRQPLAESEVGLFMTEVIRARGLWRSLDDVDVEVEVEVETLEWVDWHHHRRLHSACCDLTPAE